MEFTKMHGAGYDYIYLDCMKHTPDNLGRLAQRLSDRHFGVGGDGLICVCPSERGDFRMRMFNADGSEGAMCGNGIRCVGKFVYDRGLTNKTRLTVETSAGIKTLELAVKDGKATGATVDMGAPVIRPPVEIAVNGKSYMAIPVCMGNLHCVVPVDDPAELDLREVGPAFENWPGFPDRTNAEFIRISGQNEADMRVWERGSGETLACGTGACAGLAAMAAQGRCGREAVIHLPGGDLRVRWDEKDGHIYMTGPAVTVFDGKLAD